MDKSDYIRRSDVLRTFAMMDFPWTNCDDMYQIVRDMDGVDVISKAAFKQVLWERNMAMRQLEEYGIPFCGKAEDVVKVIRCKDCKFCEERCYGDIENLCVKFTCMVKNRTCWLNDFCSYAERKEIDNVN